MSFAHLSGDHEPFSDTIRKWIYDEWPDADKPAMISESGMNAGNTTPTENDFKILDRDQASHIRFREGENTVLESTNSLVYATTTIYIDIFSETGSDIAQKIDTIILENPRPALNKTDGTRSAVANIMEHAIDWVRIQADEKAGIVSQVAGTLDVIWRKHT